MTKITTLSFGMLLLCGSAAIAQPYDHGPREGQNYRRCYDKPYGPPECAQLRLRPDFEHYREENAATIVGYILDPATGKPINSQEYRARYPRSDPGTWQYNASQNLWVDLTPPRPNLQNSEGYRDRDRDSDQDRDRDRDRERNRDRERDRDRDGDN